MRHVVLITALGVTALACGSEAAGSERDAGQSEARESVEVTAQDRDAARGRFEKHCANCHGLDGRGRGPVAASLNPSPRNWTDPEWQESVTDEELRIVILEGGKGLGMSSLMPKSRLRPGVVEGLVEIIRGFGE